MRTVERSSNVLRFGAISLLALTVVLPPTMLAISVLLLAAAAAIWGVFHRRELLFSRIASWVLIPLSLAAFFCLLGTLPVTQKSDIQLEFVKYAIYAGAFLLGMLAIDQKETRRVFVIAVIVIIFVFFAATAVTSGARFGIDQSWVLYPPDQNNSSSILAALSPLVLAFRPRWLRISLLFLLFLFFTFAESRFGVLVILAIGFAQMLLDWRSGLVLLASAALVWGLFSLSEVGPQTTVMRAIEQITPSSPNASHEEPHISMNRIMEFGTSSDNVRLKIYNRALDVSARVFPNFLGLGDGEVVLLLNEPRLDATNDFQHAHNFFLQSFLAYGLLATLCMTVVAVSVSVLAIKYRDWHLLGALVVIGAYGMVEALVSDVRVLTVLMMVIGSSVGILLQSHVVRKDLYKK